MSKRYLVEAVSNRRVHQFLGGQVVLGAAEFSDRGQAMRACDLEFKRARSETVTVRDGSGDIVYANTVTTKPIR